MPNLLEKHVAITADIKEKIQPLKVVLPEKYGKIYAELAKTYQLELKPDELLNAEMFDERMLRHIITLTECTNSAIEAIETQNTSQLQAVLSEANKLREELHELRKIVYQDNLTHTYNRKWFDDTILDSDGMSTIQDGILVMVDLNKFKSINDTYGHVIGDKVLIHIAQKLKSTGGDVIRYGGDEFIVLFHADEKNVEEKMETALNYFKNIHFKIDNHSFKVGFAYGITHFQKGSSQSEIIHRADSAMYHHKHR